MDIRKRLKRGTAMLLVCSVASLGMAGMTLTADAAFAGNNGNKGGNSENAGGGNKGGNSASARSSNGGGQSNREAKAAEREARKLAIQEAKAAREAARAEAKAARAEAKASGAKGGNGNSGNGKYGALRAANANENAFLHASDNSRIGKLRAYRDAKVGAGVAAYEFEHSIDDLPEGYEFASAEEALAAYGDAAAAKMAYEDAAAAVAATDDLTQEDLEGLGYSYVDGDGVPLEGEDLENALADDRATERGIAQDAYDNMEYTNSMGETYSGADGEAAAQTEVDDLQVVADAHEDLGEAEADALAALLEAANKDKHLSEDQLQGYYDEVTPWVDEQLDVAALTAEEIAALEEAAAAEEGGEEEPSE